MYMCMYQIFMHTDTLYMYFCTIYVNFVALVNYRVHKLDAAMKCS